MRHATPNSRARSGPASRSVGRNLIALAQGFAANGLLLLAGGCAPSQAEPKEVASLTGYSEGIVFDAQGAAFVSVLHGDTVYVVRGSASPADWYRTVEPNGHKVLQDGTHLIAARGGVHHVDAEGTLIEVLGPELVTPNDLALDGDGGVYVTVPAESDQSRRAEQSGVYYIDSSRAVHKVADDFCYPNGIAVRPDGTSLLVNDSCNRRIYEFQIESPGVVSGRRLFAELPGPRAVPDGMTLDRAGQIYVADYGAGVIRVLSPSGVAVREYPTGLEHPSNVAFGGDRFTDLYVTGSPEKEEGSGRLVVLRLGVPGRSSLTLPASIGGK